MKTFIRPLSVAALLTACGSPALAYTYTGVGDKGGWDDINGSSTTTAVLDGSDYTNDTSFGNVDTALRNAYATWDAVPGATNLNFDIRADNGGNYDVVDGPGATVDSSADYNYANITMGGWLSAGWFTDAFGAEGSSILAVTFSGRIGRGRNATWIADIYFNDGFNWSTDGGAGYDIETVMLHELGHAIGMGHEDSVPSVMATYYGGVQRTLLADDIAGVELLYGGGGGTGGGGKPNNGRGPNKIIINGLDADLYGIGITVIPEPSSLALLSLGGLMLARRRR